MHSTDRSTLTYSMIIRPLHVIFLLKRWFPALLAGTLIRGIIFPFSWTFQWFSVNKFPKRLWICAPWLDLSVIVINSNSFLDLEPFFGLVFVWISLTSVLPSVAGNLVVLQMLDDPENFCVGFCFGLFSYLSAGVNNIYILFIACWDFPAIYLVYCKHYAMCSTVFITAWVPAFKSSAVYPSSLLVWRPLSFLFLV